jgi:hypothetical protein
MDIDNPRYIGCMYKVSLVSVAPLATIDLVLIWIILALTAKIRNLVDDTKTINRIPDKIYSNNKRQLA